jgi:hypothetical protein
VRGKAAGLRGDHFFFLYFRLADNGQELVELERLGQEIKSSSVEGLFGSFHGGKTGNNDVFHFLDPQDISIHHLDNSSGDCGRIFLLLALTSRPMKVRTFLSKLPKVKVMPPGSSPGMVPISA